MKKNQLIFLLLFFIIFSCNKEKITKTNTENKYENNSKTGNNSRFKTKEVLKEEKLIRKDTLLLSLSPSMSEFEFEKAKESLFVDGNLELPTENGTISFEVLQNNKAIRLITSRIFSINELNKLNQFKHYRKVFSLFEKKYHFHNYADFNGLNYYSNPTKTFTYLENNSFLEKKLKEYNFKDKYYSVLSNSKKTIVMSYSLKEINSFFLVSQSPDDEDPFSKKIKYEKPEYNDIKRYTPEIKIDYFFNKDFKELKNNLNEKFSNYLDSINLKLNNRKKILERNKRGI